MTARATTTRSTLPAITNAALIGFTSNGIRLDDILIGDETGITYRATQVASARPVQVWIADARFAADETFCERFRRESDQLVTLRHLYISCCLEHWEWVGPQKERLLALVNEAITGLSLTELRHQARMSVRDILVICSQAAEGLAAAHQLGIIHGNLTGRSLIISEGGFTKVNGFSLGRGDYCIAGNERRILASPESMAPEVCRGQAPNSVSDIYSLGVILYEALMGEVPFPAVNALESLHLQSTGQIPSISKQLSGSEDIDLLVQRMLAKDANVRPQTMSEVAKELLGLCGKIPGTLRCLAPLSQESLSLSALVKKGMQKESNSTIPAMAVENSALLVAQTRPEKAPGANAQSGGTTTISRSSTEYFTNPDLFKPTGATPALGSPIIQGSLPSLETASNQKPITQRLGQKPETARVIKAPVDKIQTEKRVKDQPETVKSNDVEQTKIHTPVQSYSYLWIGLGASAAIIAVGLIWFLLPPGGDVSQTDKGKNGNANSATTPQIDLLTLSIAELERKITSIEQLAVVDPSQALALAAQLRQQHPGEDLSRLPLPLRLVLDGPSWDSVEIYSDGKLLPRPKDAVICRWSNRAMTVSISASDFLAAEVNIAPSTLVAEQIQIVRLPNKPLWQLAPFAPMWVNMLPHPAGVVMASDQKIVLIDSSSGQEIQRLDNKIVPGLPTERIGWAFVSTATKQKKLFSTATGVCVAMSDEPVLSATIIHSGERTVSALEQAPLALRLNAIGTFTIERTAGSYWLNAYAPERRLWTKALTGMQPPTLSAVHDHLLLCLDNAVWVVDQEGMIAQEISLPSNRTNTAAWIEPGRLLAIPTRNGVRRLLIADNGQWALDKQPPMVNGNIVALSYDADELIVMSEVSVQVFKRRVNDLGIHWQEKIPTEGQLKHLGISQNQYFIADSIGNIFVMNRSDGKIEHHLRLRSPALAPPYLQGEIIMIAESNGLISGFTLPKR